MIRYIVHLLKLEIANEVIIQHGRSRLRIPTAVIVTVVGVISSLLTKYISPPSPPEELEKRMKELKEATEAKVSAVEITSKKYQEETSEKVQHIKDQVSIQRNVDVHNLSVLVAGIEGLNARFQWDTGLPPERIELNPIPLNSKSPKSQPRAALVVPPEVK